jgi:hypothetical protein
MAWEIAKGILIAVAILFAGLPLALFVLFGLFTIVQRPSHTTHAPEMELRNVKGTCILVEKRADKRKNHV